MGPARFWDLIDSLGGVADDQTTGPLHELLVASGEGDAFRSTLEDLVRALLDTCDVPPLYRGDTSEWIAAAVVARGRDVYERVLAAGADLDPEEWAWGESEAIKMGAPCSANCACITLATGSAEGWPDASG